MQKALTELVSISPDELSQLANQMREPLLITSNGEPQFVAQSLSAFETMVRRLRDLEAERRNMKSGAERKFIPIRS